ncbi:hypothetical protein ARAM_007244 [Aspergillus rambellii]|uniref:Uncharacterized protein n=3 Tax=Aspergillus subgen. Nidulantes TaxID=2720870 RepID=A0A0F8XI39_9EURO|nr:hypothetical protein ARAM_007244 [Aspergillus rambellii]
MIIQSSFNHPIESSHYFASKNGFVHGCIEAYNYHHHLVLRPDDVWFAMLTQLSVHVHAHLEDQYHFLVDHEGQKELVIQVASIDRTDKGAFAVIIAFEMQKCIIDADLREWVVPEFTTTTVTDRATASAVMMGTMQKHFVSVCEMSCGLPSVTLLGTFEDWVKLREKSKRLIIYGDEPRRWYEKLRPVLDSFVNTFIHPESDAVRDFWQSICDIKGESGSSTFSGWITTFCFWDENGVCLHDTKPGETTELGLDEMPVGFVKLPARLEYSRITVETEILAGSVAVRASKQSTQGQLDTVQPECGWFMYEV